MEPAISGPEPTTTNMPSTTRDTEPTATNTESRTLLTLPGEIRNLIYDEIFWIQDRGHIFEAVRLINRQFRREYEAQALHNMRMYIYEFGRAAWEATGYRLGFALPSNYRELFTATIMIPLNYLFRLGGSPPDPAQTSIPMAFLLSLPAIVHTVIISFFEDSNDASSINEMYFPGGGMWRVCHAVSLYFTKRDDPEDCNTIERVEVRWNEHLDDPTASTVAQRTEVNNQYWEGEYFRMAEVIGRYSTRINGLRWQRRRAGQHPWNRARG